MTSARTSPSSRRSGFTLIEVAIALVIFVIGALAIVRIFPGALGVIQNSGDRLVAVNQNRAILAAYRNNPMKVPEGIYDAGGTWAAPWGTGSTVGSSSRNNSLPRNLADFEFSALGHFKQVRGEKIRFGSTQGYTTTNFPYVQADRVKVFQEDSLQNVRTDADGNLDFSQSWRATTGSSVPFSQTPRVPTEYQYTDGITPDDTIFYVTYRYVQNSRIWTIEDEPVTDTGGAAGPRLTRGTASAGSVVAGSVDVRFRRFLNFYTPTDANEAGVGFVNLSAFTLQSQDVVSLDYTVKDWRWIVHEATPDPDRNIVLPIKGVDDARTNIGFSMLWEGSAAPTFVGITTPIADSDLKILRRNRYPVGTSSFSAPQARVVYWTLDNWAQQTSVAAKTYLPFNTTYPTETWRSYALVDNILYFPPSEAGKVITVSYSYNDVAAVPTDSSTDVQQERRVFTIEDDLIPKPTGLPGGFESSNWVSRVVLTDNVGDDFNNPATAVTSIRAVDGASIQVRSAWMDGDRFSQNSLMGYRRFE